MIRSAPVIAALAVALAGCATSPPLADGLPASAPRSIELDSTPYFPQEDYQCGPAALATLLVASGVDVTPESLAPEVFLPERRGSLALELVGAARRHGRLPYVLATTADEMVEELEAGRPVLVLQNLGVVAAARSGTTPCSSATTRSATSRCCAPGDERAPRDELAALRRHLAPRRALRDDDAASRRDSGACGARALHRGGRRPRGRGAAARGGRGLRRRDRALARRAAWPGSGAATSPTRTATGRRRGRLSARHHARAGRCGGAQQPRGAPARCRLPRGIAPADRARFRARGRHGARSHGRGQPREDRRDCAGGRRAASSRTAPGRTERALRPSAARSRSGGTGSSGRTWP